IIQRHSPSATSFLLMSVKRNGSKEKRFPDRANPATRWRRDFSTRHPCRVEKRRTSMCGALRVCRLAKSRCDLQKPKAKGGKRKAESGNGNRVRPGAHQPPNGSSGPPNHSHRVIHAHTN